MFPLEGFPELPGPPALVANGKDIPAEAAHAEVRGHGAKKQELGGKREGEIA